MTFVISTLTYSIETSLKNTTTLENIHNHKEFRKSSHIFKLKTNGDYLFFLIRSKTKHNKNTQTLLIKNYRMLFFLKSN